MMMNALNGCYGSQPDKFSFEGPVFRLLFLIESAMIPTVLAQPVRVPHTLPTPLTGVCTWTLSQSREMYLTVVTHTIFCHTIH